MFKNIIQLEEISNQNGALNPNSNFMYHVLANEIDLNLKYRIGLKQIFNINLGICIIKKTIFFVRIFDIIIGFQVFIVFGVARFVKSMSSGYSLDAEFNYAFKEPSRSKFE